MTELSCPASAMQNLTEISLNTPAKPTESIWTLSTLMFTAQRIMEENAKQVFVQGGVGIILGFLFVCLFK